MKKSVYLFTIVALVLVLSSQSFADDLAGAVYPGATVSFHVKALIQGQHDKILIGKTEHLACYLRVSASPLDRTIDADVSAVLSGASHTSGFYDFLGSYTLNGTFLIDGKPNSYTDIYCELINWSSVPVSDLVQIIQGAQGTVYLPPIAPFVPSSSASNSRDPRQSNVQSKTLGGGLDAEASLGSGPLGESSASAL